MDSFDSLKPLRWVLKVYKFFGLWHNGPKSKSLQIYGYLLHVFFTTFFIILQVVNLFMKDSFEEVAEWMFLALCELALLMKVWNLLLKNDLFRELVDHLELMQPIDLEEEQVFEQSSGVMGLARIARVHYSISIMAHVSSSLVAILIVVSGNYQCPYVQWFYGYKCSTGGFVFYIVYAYQLFTITMHCLVNITTDIFISGIVANLVGQTAVLGLRFKNLTERNNSGDNKAQVKDVSNNDEILLHEKFVTCINRHRKIKQYAELFQNEFQLAIFCQTLMSAFVICCSAYRLSSMSFQEDPGGMIYLMTFSTSMIVQIGMPCYYGCFLEHESLELTFNAYCCEWYLKSQRFKNNLWHFLVHAKKPIEISSPVTIFKLNLVTFQEVLNKAYSLFAVLESME